MNPPDPGKGRAAVLLAAAAYVATGLVLAALANAHGPGPARRAWTVAWTAATLLRRARR